MDSKIIKYFLLIFFISFKVSAVEFEGTRYDLGEPLGYLVSSIKVAMERSEFKKPLLEEMKKLLASH